MKRKICLLLIIAMVIPMLCVSAYAFTSGTVGEKNVISLGENRAIMVTEDGSVYTWGYDSGSDLEDGITQKPRKVMDGAESVYCGNYHFAAIKKDGSLWTWGRNNGPYGKGALGNDSTEDRNWTPQKIMDDVAAVSLGNDHSAAIKEDGSLWMWGNNRQGELGLELTDANLNVLQPVKVMDDVKSVALGENTTAVIKEDGSLWTWGSNYYGVLGTGSITREVYSEQYHGMRTINTWEPTKIMDNVVCVSIHRKAAVAVKEDGTAYWWGGVSTEGQVLSPVKLTDNVSSVTVGTHHMAVVKNDGSLWTWGNNLEGQIGNGQIYEVEYSLVKVMDNVDSASVNFYQSAAVKSDGTIWVWGCNCSGELGIGEGKGNANEGKNQTVPVQLTGFEVEATKCKITLELDGGNGSTAILCRKNGLVTPPNNPVKDGYFFAGWYKDKDCTKLWNFDTDYVSENCTLYAKWLPKTTSTVIAEPSTQVTRIDNDDITFSTYILRDANGYAVNFVKLRDVAFLLNGTKAQFNVEWRNNAIRLNPNSAYTGQNGAELTVPTVVSAPTQTSLTPVLTNGVSAPLEAFLLIDENGGGHTYFKLRDIGKVAGFNVDWDSSRNCVVIKTNEKYSD